MKYCNNCGTQNEDSYHYCANCSAPLPEADSSNQSQPNYNQNQSYSNQSQQNTPYQQPAQPQQNYYPPQQQQQPINIYNTQQQAIPPQYQPISAWGYFGYSLLFSIPIAGFILLIVFSFNNSNINRRNFARSHFCMLLVIAIIAAIVLIISLIIGSSAINTSSSYYYY